MERARVVLIDDDPAQAEILALIFRRQRPQWQVELRVIDERHARQLQSEPATVLGQDLALVVVDYRLGEQVVVELLPALRSLAPVVVLTGSLAGCDLEACRAAGAAAVVAKPYTLGEASAALSACDRALAGET